MFSMSSRFLHSVVSALGGDFPRPAATSLFSVVLLLLSPPTTTRNGPDFLRGPRAGLVPLRRRTSHVVGSAVVFWLPWRVTGKEQQVKQIIKETHLLSCGIINNFSGPPDLSLGCL